jgi:hypothetical protein
MSWLYVLLLIGAALAVGRIWYSIKKLRELPRDDWDTRLIERLRRSGANAFSPMELDFFLAMPSEGAAQGAAEQLKSEGFAVDVRAVAESTDQPFSVHATRSMHLNVDGVRAVSTRLREIAAAQGGRYDGWTASQGRGG